MLVVDDDVSIIEMIGSVLEHAGYRVLTAHNGRTALAIARRERPAVVLTDRNMPEMDGIEFARRLRASPVTNNIPVVLMSSLAPTLDSTDSAARMPFLAKPFDLEEMLAAIAIYAGQPDPDDAR